MVHGPTQATGGSIHTSHGPHRTTAQGHVYFVLVRERIDPPGPARRSGLMSVVADGSKACCHLVVTSCARRFDPYCRTLRDSRHVYSGQPVRVDYVVSLKNLFKSYRHYLYSYSSRVFAQVSRFNRFMVDHAVPQTTGTRGTHANNCRTRAAVTRRRSPLGLASQRSSRCSRMAC